jgi:exodeoxyribonuclease VIII
MLNKEENHVMVDLETMGTKCDAAIIAIGAVKFNEEKVLDTFYRVIDLQSCIDIGLTVDGGTFMWWLTQSDEARMEFENAPKTALMVALAEFSDWIGDDAYVWGNGAAFDNAILSTAYSKAHMIQPWDFWRDRCYRTVKNMNPHVKMERSGTYHNALDDARSQAEHLINMFRCNYARRRR